MSASTIRIKRTLTDSPLARMHARAMEGRPPRRPQAIPWGRFNRGTYPAPALALAGNAQPMLATGEYGAVSLFSQLASALARHGAPFDLISLAARVPADEIRHADYAIRF